MDKLSEYLPVIIILVSIVFTIIGKIKKQEKITEATTLPGHQAGEVIDEDSLPRPFTGSYRKIVEEKPKKQVFYQPEIKQRKEITPISSTPIVLESEDEEDSSFSFEEDDVVRAIIYTEIINRKEY